MAKSEEVKAVRTASDYICSKLNGNGFHILRYDSPYSTYIKIDGGVCNSIRISNHMSSKIHLAYRYNVLIGLDEDYISKDDKRGYDKYYFTKDSLDILIKMIIVQRDIYVKRYGELNYLSYVLRDLKENKNNKSGFWCKAKTLKNTNKNKFEYNNGITYTNKLRKANLELQRIENIKRSKEGQIKLKKKKA